MVKQMNKCAKCKIKCRRDRRKMKIVFHLEQNQNDERGGCEKSHILFLEDNAQKKKTKKTICKGAILRYNNNQQSICGF